MAEPQVVYPFKELEKFQIFTETPGVEGKRSRLGWSSYRGNPRINVFTNVPNDAQKGMMSAAMNPETFLIFLNMLEEFAVKPGEQKAKIDCYTIPRAIEGQERSTDKILASEIYFGRDAQGILWISVVVANRPKIKFEFKISDFHKIYKGDGTQLTPADGSSLQTLATVKALRTVFMEHMSELRPPYVPNGQGVSKSVASKVQSEGFDDITF